MGCSPAGSLQSTLSKQGYIVYMTKEDMFTVLRKIQVSMYTVIKYFCFNNKGLKHSFVLYCKNVNDYLSLSTNRISVTEKLPNFHLPNALWTEAVEEEIKYTLCVFINAGVLKQSGDCRHPMKKSKSCNGRKKAMSGVQRKRTERKLTRVSQ